MAKRGRKSSRRTEQIGTSGREAVHKLIMDEVHLLGTGWTTEEDQA